MTDWWTLGHVLRALTGREVPEPTPTVLDFGLDSRVLGVGGLFIALPGTRTDGHHYVVHAFANRARAALVHREVDASNALVLDLRTLDWSPPASWGQPLVLRVEDALQGLQKLARYWRARFPHLQVVGITGSVGKTTTKELVAQVLALHAATLKNPGNYNSEIGLPLSLVRARGYHRFAVLEMGFYVPGDIALLCHIARPHVGIVTTIDRVHAERAGSLEAIFRGKAELVQSLPPEGVAVLNTDDPWVWPMRRLTQARVVGYGLAPHAQVRASHIETRGLEGIRFRLHAEGRAFTVSTPLLGKHAVYNALAATAAARALGIPWETILTALAHAHQLPRLRPFPGPQGAWILDDAYNAAPRSTLAALDFLAELPGERIAVLGDMLELGPYEEEGHVQVGRRAAQVVQYLIAVGPRARILAQAAMKAGLPREAVFLADDPEEALRALLPKLHPRAVVLVKASRAVGLDRLIARLKEEVAHAHA